MSNNAMWWVHYMDLTVPYHSECVLSLSSTDLRDPKKAHARARKVAAERLTKKLGKGSFKVLRSQCVG